MTSSAPLRALARARRAVGRVSQQRRLIALAAVAVVGGAACIVWPDVFRLAAVETLVLIVAGLLLRAAAMIRLAIVVGVVSIAGPLAFDRATISVSGAVLLVAVGLAAILQAVRRERLGLGELSAESVIGQVRGRMRVQSEVPALPHGWSVEVQQRAADGAAIAGDFVSSRLTVAGSGPVLDVAVVDVSGSGIEAGTRALLLSGAVGGLLGAVAPDDLLPQVNAYLIRQRWAAGFATCAYVRVHLDTGAIEVRAAGHPPPLRRGAAGTWSECHSAGTLLGVVENLTSAPYRGALGPGDALVIVTDGVIEDRIEPMEAGVARLRSVADAYLGRPSTLIAASGESDLPRDPADGLAGVLVDSVPTRRDDDRAVVVIRRLADARAAPAEDGGSAGEDRATS